MKLATRNNGEKMSVTYSFLVLNRNENKSFI